MKKAVVIGFILLFMLQISVKSLVSLYFKTIDTTTAQANCTYKTITICKGSCYIAKKIKVFASTASTHKNHLPGFDLQTFKDFVAIYTSPVPSDEPILPVTKFLLNHSVQLYSFKTTKLLIKPPIA